jgi:hypothetical protein
MLASLIPFANRPPLRIGKMRKESHGTHHIRCTVKKCSPAGSRAFSFSFSKAGLQFSIGRITPLPPPHGAPHLLLLQATCAPTPDSSLPRATWAWKRRQKIPFASHHNAASSWHAHTAAACWEDDKENRQCLHLLHLTEPCLASLCPLARAGASSRR